LSAQDASASHTIFLVENPTQNPNGGVNGKLYGINLEWEITSQKNLVCSDYGPNYTNLPLEIRNAISSWESVLTGTQFNQGCGSGRSATWFLRRTVTPGYPANCVVFVACVVHLFGWEPSRQASYPGSTNIWINNLNYTFNSSGLRGTAAHELGHSFGLDEAYIENPVACNSARTSVMDALMTSGSLVIG